MAEEKPRTLIRTGFLEGDLGEVARKFNPEVWEFNRDIGENVNYGFYTGPPKPFLLTVSQKKDNLLYLEGHNSILAVTSYDDFHNLQVVEEFERATGIKYDMFVPRHLIDESWLNNGAFRVLLEHGQRAIDVLRVKEEPTSATP